MQEIFEDMFNQWCNLNILWYQIHKFIVFILSKQFININMYITMQFFLGKPLCSGGQIWKQGIYLKQGWFWICAQPTREGVT